MNKRKTQAEVEPLVMKVESWPIDRPIAYGRNPRKIPQSAIDKTAALIKEFGFRVPIIVDENDVIIAGHTRLQASRKLGLTEVPVHVAAELTKEQAKAFRIAENRSHEEASWDAEMLALEFEELKDVFANIDEVTAFDLEELASIYAGTFNSGTTGSLEVSGSGSSGVNNPEAEWAGMPGYTSEDKMGIQLIVHFKTEEDRQSFAELTGQSLTPQTKYIWYPKQENADLGAFKYVTEE